MNSKTFNELVNNLGHLLSSEIKYPNIVSFSGIFYFENRSVAVVSQIDEIKEICDNECQPLLGLYCTDETISKLIIYPDAIKSQAQKLSREVSINRNPDGSITDLRKTHSSFGDHGRRNGLWEDDAFNAIETFCRLQIVIYHTIHHGLESWNGKYYSEYNSDLIDNLVIQASDRLINDIPVLVRVRNYLQENIFNNSSIVYEITEFVPFIHNLPSTSQDEWMYFNDKIIDVVNLFPITDKSKNETWLDFFNRLKDETSVQNKLVLAMFYQGGIEITKFIKFLLYLSSANQEMYRGAIAAKRYGV